jgi:putative pyruvate formate lyase activating enzyme
MWKHQRPDSIAVFDDPKATKSLRRYLAVVKDEKPAKFLIAKRLKAEFEPTDKIDELWKKHTALTFKFLETQRQIDAGQICFDEMPLPEKSYLDLKIEITNRILRKCRLCTHACGVDRLRREVGYCGCGKDIVVSSIFAHMGEEPELVPSGTIFTMGCTMRCKHCQNWTISQWVGKGQTMTPSQLAAEIAQLRINSCRNANLVGGEPTPWLQQWLATFKQANTNIPIVWNSNSYYSQETANLLAGFIDVYLLDFKYGPNKCAQRISDAPGYWNVCTHNHLEAKKSGETIIRVLVLPNHLDCCVRSILDWISENLGTETRINLMFQYRPEWRANQVPELHRTLSAQEIEEADELLRKANLTNLAS